MINTVDFKKHLRKATTHNVKAILLFFESKDVVTYEQIAQVVGKSNADKDMGRTVGGILSALSRTTFEGEPLVIPLGPAEDSRRLIWKLNPQAINESNKDELIEIVQGVLQERGL